MLTARKFALVAVLSGVLASAGCTNPWMPVAGPESWDVRSQASDVAGTDDRLPYALVKLTPQVIDVQATNAPRLASAFTDRRPAPQLRFGLGDVVSVTIFEAAAGGLFIPSEAGVRPGNFVSYP